MNHVQAIIHEALTAFGSSHLPTCGLGNSPGLNQTQRVQTHVVLPHVAHHSLMNLLDLAVFQGGRSYFRNTTQNILFSLKCSHTSCADELVALGQDKLYIIWNQVTPMNHNQILHAAHKVQVILPDKPKISRTQVRCTVIRD